MPAADAHALASSHAAGPTLGLPEDVGQLVDASAPRGGWQGLWVLWLPPIGLICLLLAIVVMATGEARSGVAESLLVMALLLVSGGSTLALTLFTRRHREELEKLRQAEELVRLRHWPQASYRLARLLGEPMRQPGARHKALFLLSSVLIRFGRYDDAVRVAEAVSEDPSAEPALRYMTEVNRAMALLRGDRLFDAGDAISKLRRTVNKADAAARRLRDRLAEAAEEHGVELKPAAIAALEQLPEKPDIDSAALSLVELYRDVHTGHPEEAIAGFDAKRDRLRRELGLRFADALALVAAAHHRLGDLEAARSHWRDALVLQPHEELTRRFPETNVLAEQFGTVPGLDGSSTVEPRPLPAADPHPLPQTLSLLSRTGRMLIIARVISWMLLAGVVLMLIGGFVGLDVVGFIGLVVISVWVLLGLRSATHARAAEQSAGLIVEGNFDAAERAIEVAATGFGLLSQVKLVGIYRLAQLRRLQDRPADALAAARFVLGRMNRRVERRAVPGMVDDLLLTAAESLVRLRRPIEAFQVLMQLHRRRLVLDNALRLLVVQLEYQAQIEDWQGIAQFLESKLQTAELLPPPAMLRAFRHLAQAAERTGQLQWASLLSRRVRLLEEPASE